MRAQLTYPTKASFHLVEHWPLDTDNIEIRFEVTNSAITAIVCTWPLTSADRPPQIQPLAEGLQGMGKVDFHLARRSGVEHLVRTIQGLLALHGTIDVDFQRPTLTWLADNPDEEMGIRLTLSAKPSAVDLYKPETLDFGLVARVVAGAPTLGAHEVALSFLRRGRRDLREGRYIESIYNSFFFLETQFAPGFSDPKKVARRFKDNTLIRASLATIRRDPVDPPRGRTTTEELALWDERVAALDRTDEEIIDELVSLRGKLHHHAAKGPQPWHPDKSAGYRVPAHTLHDIAFGCAHLLVGSVLADQALDASLMHSAERAGAVTKFLFTAEGLFPTQDVTQLILGFVMAGTAIDRPMVASADRAFRRALYEQEPTARLDGYTITHQPSGRLYGRYERFNFGMVTTGSPETPTSIG